MRELRNVVERLMLLSDARVDREAVRMALPAAASDLAGPSQASGSLAERVEAFEREVLLKELERHSYHMTETAKALGLERSHLYKKC